MKISKKWQNLFLAVIVLGLLSVNTIILPLMMCDSEVEWVMPCLLIIALCTCLTVIVLSTTNRGYNFGQREREGNISGKGHKNLYVCNHNIMNRRPLKPIDYELVQHMRCLGQNHVMTHSTDNQGCQCMECLRLLCKDIRCVCRAPLFVER